MVNITQSIYCGKPRLSNSHAFIYRLCSNPINYGRTGKKIPDEHGIHEDHQRDQSTLRTE